MKFLAAFLVIAAIPCMAQQNPGPGLARTSAYRAYFVVRTYSVREPGQPNGQMEGLTQNEEGRWAEKQHKKYPGLCYLAPGAGAAGRNPTLAARIRQSQRYVLTLYVLQDWHQETKERTRTSTQDVPVHGTADVYDQYGQPLGTADVQGTATVETTERYPVSSTIYTDGATGYVDRVNSDNSLTQVIEVSKSRRTGDRGVFGVAEAFKRDPRENALNDCLKSIAVDAGLIKSGP
jgi:hypothetical protein